MVRRRKSLWGSAAFQKSMTSLTRSAWRTGSKILAHAVKTAAKRAAAPTVKSVKASRPAATSPAPRRARKSPVNRPGGAAALPPTQRGGAPGSATRGVALGPAGARTWQLYMPPELSRSARVPLVVMLHGCGQTAAAFALSTRMNRLAAREGFCVLYPEQDRRANPQGCWNWYAVRSRTAHAEAATLLAAIDQVALIGPVDAARVAVAGFSAGAGMAALLASRYPARFRAVVMHSGVPPGVAKSSASALAAMLGTRRAPPSVESLGTAAWPPLLVIHGTADSVVAASNGRSAAAMWAAATGAQGAAPRVVQRGQRHPMTVTDYKRRGHTMVRLCEIDRLAHAWSGGAASQAHGDTRGPDATGMVWAFVTRQIAGMAVAALAG